MIIKTGITMFAPQSSAGGLSNAARRLQRVTMRARRQNICQPCYNSTSLKRRKLQREEVQPAIVTAVESRPKQDNLVTADDRRRIYIEGFGTKARFIAFCLLSSPNPPPITFVFTKRWIFERYVKARGRFGVIDREGVYHEVRGAHAERPPVTQPYTGSGSSFRHYYLAHLVFVPSDKPSVTVRAVDTSQYFWAGHRAGLVDRTCSKEDSSTLGETPLNVAKVEPGGRSSSGKTFEVPALDILLRPARPIFHLISTRVATQQDLTARAFKHRLSTESNILLLRTGVGTADAMLKILCEGNSQRPNVFEARTRWVVSCSSELVSSSVFLGLFGCRAHQVC